MTHLAWYLVGVVAAAAVLLTGAVLVVVSLFGVTLRHMDDGERGEYVDALTRRLRS